MNYKILLLFFLCGFFLYSCNAPKEPSATSDSIPIPPSVRSDSSDQELLTFLDKDTLIMSPFVVYDSKVNPAVMHDKAMLYFTFDTSSSSRKEIPIFSPVTILERGGIYTKKANPQPNDFPYLLKHALIKIEVSGDTGYINAKDVCYFYFKNEKAKCYYFVSINDAADSELLIYKYRTEEKKITDTLPLLLGGSDSEFLPDYIRFRDDIGLRNCSGVLDVYRVDEYCGGGSASRFIVDANSLSLLITVGGGGGELCESSSSTVCLPFVQKGDTISCVNNPAKPDLNKAVKDVLKNPALHSTQLLIRSSYQTSGIYDEQGEPVLDKNGDCKEKITKDMSEIFYWNGATLILLKEVDHLKN